MARAMHRMSKLSLRHPHRHLSTLTSSKSMLMALHSMGLLVLCCIQFAQVALLLRCTMEGAEMNPKSKLPSILRGFQQRKQHVVAIKSYFVSQNCSNSFPLLFHDSILATGFRFFPHSSPSLFAQIGRAHV